MASGLNDTDPLKDGEKLVLDPSGEKHADIERWATTTCKLHLLLISVFYFVLVLSINDLIR